MPVVPTVPTNPSTIKVLIVYRDQSTYGPNLTSHCGLCLNAYWTRKMLNSAGISCLVAPVGALPDIVKAVTVNDPTHVVIEAQFLKTIELQSLVLQFPSVHFVQRCHSQIAFLAVAPVDITLLREYLYLQDIVHNLQVSSNSSRFCTWVENAYHQNCLLLPNGYVLGRPGVHYHSPKIAKDTYKMASFGAIRLLKNQATAAAAALQVCRQLGKQLEFHMNAGRAEHGNGVLTSIKNMFSGLSWATLVLDPWTDWAHFRQLVSTMDLCFQLSSTETFNLVTADACADGVASVVGDCIEWAPQSWMSSIDNPNECATVASHLLMNPLAVQQGQLALSKFCEESLRIWKSWLGV